MQPVGVVAPDRHQAGALQPADQLALAVDPHVTTGHVVVLVGQGPVDELGPAPGHGDRHRPAAAEHPGQLGHGRLVVGDVLEHLGGDDPVEGAVGEGQPEGIALDGAHPGRFGVELAGHRHGPEGVLHVAHLVGAGVEGHHLGAQPGRLIGVPAEAASEVEEPVAGPHPELA